MWIAHVRRARHRLQAVPDAAEGCSLLLEPLVFRVQAMFFLVLAFGVLFLAAMLCINADINMQNASLTIIHRLSKTVALRQVCCAVTIICMFARSCARAC